MVTKSNFKYYLISLFILFMCGSIISAGDWRVIEDGLEIGWFASADSLAGDSMITIVRVNPKRFDLEFYSVADSNGTANLSVRKWCEKEDLLLAINGGMYDQDYRTHIGYLKANGEVKSTHRNKYRSAAALHPREDSLPEFRIYDLDVDSLDSIAGKYESVAQNLRLIKRPGVSRWSADKNRKWTEAALAEDSAGNALFILCRQSMTMYEFNKRILELPLGIVAAQHLEGGVQTQMYVRAGEITLGLSGGFDSRMDKVSDEDFFFKLPHVIGVKRVLK